MRIFQTLANEVNIQTVGLVLVYSLYLIILTLSR